MKPLISVIIPVYNVEKYIIECLESVRNQTFRDFEVIIVNDGTKDNSAGLAEKFILQNGLENFFLVNKQNGGLSSARNAGIERARGQWLFFLDSDDWITEDALDILVRCMKKNPADLIIGGYQAYDQSTGRYETWNNYPVEYGEMPKDLHGLHSFSFCVARLYKKEIIDTHRLRFDERIQYAEDNAWQFDYNCNIRAYACTNETIYYYRINRSGSLTSRLITPNMKRHIGEHMFRFFDLFDDELIAKSLEQNPRLLSVTWGVFTTDIINEILDKQYRKAWVKRKSELSRSILQAFSPRSKKEQVFLAMYRASFLMLCVFVIVYYDNFEKLRRSKVMRKWSARK